MKREQGRREILKPFVPGKVVMPPAATGVADADESIVGKDFCRRAFLPVARGPMLFRQRDELRNQPGQQVEVKPVLHENHPLSLLAQ